MTSDKDQRGRYRKRPIAVPVVFARAPGVMQTLEGPVPYALGDALMTGVKGEQWPIPYAQFCDRYALVRAPTEGEVAWYVKKPMTVTAYQATAPMQLALTSGAVLAAKPGDWVVEGPDGAQWVVDAVIFGETYEAIDD